MGLTFRNKITNNFNDEVIYTSSRGKDLKGEIRSLCHEHQKTEKDFIITKI